MIISAAVDARMGTYLIWWTAIAFEAILLFRGIWTRLLRKYPLFYGYIGWVLATDLIGLLTYHVAPDLYVPLYWPSEFVTIVASYAVIVEIFRWSTRHKPGIRRLTQKVLLTVFALTVAYAFSDFAHGGFRSVSRAIADLGRDLRYVEAGVLVIMLWLFARYRIPLGRNLLGLIGGYSFWLACNIVNLAFWFRPANELSIVLRELLPATYLLTLIIWCASLWSAQPEPARPSENRIERDYDLLATNTNAILARTSHQFFRLFRP
jgi:hypothetical protein